MKHMLRMNILCSSIAILSVGSARSADATIVFSGWDYKLKKPTWDIYGIPATGGPSKLVAGGQANESAVPVFSNTMRRLAYEIAPFAFPGERAVGFLFQTEEKLFRDTETRRVFKANLDTGAITDLGLSVNAGTTCDASPDGKQIACADGVGKYYQIFIFDVETKQKRQVTKALNDCLDPSWSPDGKKLAFHVGDDAELLGKVEKPQGWHLAVYDLESSEYLLLTNMKGAKDYHPRWSPDGKWIAYYRGGKKRGEWNIWMIRPDGTEDTQLTTGTQEKSYPYWSPDSKQIVFQCYRSKPGTYDICSVDIETRKETSITNTDNVDEQQPAWVK